MDAYLGMIMIWPLSWAPQGWMFCNGALLTIQQYNALFSLLGTTYGGDGRANFALPDLRGRVPFGVNYPVLNGYPNLPLGTAYGASWSGATAKSTGLVTAQGTANITTDNLPAHTHAATFTPGGAPTVNVAIPVDNSGSSTNVPGATTILGKAVMGATAVKAYSTNPSNDTLAPFSVTLPASSGSVTVANTGGGAPLAVSMSLQNLSLPVKTTTSPSIDISPYQPGLCLNFIICTEGLYPPRP